MKRSPLTPLLFLLPYGVLFVTFVLAPVAYGLWISLHDWHILSARPEWVGGANYAGVLRDDLFWIALQRTLLFAAITVPLGNLVSLLLAIGLNQNFRGSEVFKTAFYLPVVLSVTVVAILWQWLYSGEFGLVNQMIGAVTGRKPETGWLRNTETAMPAIAIMSVWWGAGGAMLIYLAGLRNVPKELMEAASIDGAGPWNRFWNITWPLLKPTTLFNVVMAVIASFQVFGQTLILTQGGPYYSTLTVVLYLYQQGFGQYRLGYAAAIGYLLFAVIFLFSLLQFRLLAGREARA